MVEWMRNSSVWGNTSRWQENKYLRQILMQILSIYVIQIQILYRTNTNSILQTSVWLSGGETGVVGKYKAGARKQIPKANTMMGPT